ncbi:Arc family DNA-binding protein [Pseudorhodoferax sp. LjRoot39]|uniref:Arc family DNA-binding protein n=1 Tax=Pseudorhodoferax sp. LjRoot39 TaxID=3342328 RepID=UPI003ECC1E0B
MARSEPQLNFRCPLELREQLERAAAESKRSLTSELVARLQASFNPQGGGVEPDWDLLVEQRVLDLRIGALDDAMRLYRMMKDALLARIDELGHADPEGKLPAAIQLARELDGVLVGLVERLSMARSHYSVVAAKISAAERRRTQRIDEVIAVRQVEDEIRDLEAEMARIEEACSDVGVTQAQADAAEAAERERRLHFIRRMSGPDPFEGIDAGRPKAAVEAMHRAPASKKSLRQ